MEISTRGAPSAIHDPATAPACTGSGSIPSSLPDLAGIMLRKGMIPSFQVPSEAGMSSEPHGETLGTRGARSEAGKCPSLEPGVVSRKIPLGTSSAPGPCPGEAQLRSQINPRAPPTPPQRKLGQEAAQLTGFNIYQGYWPGWSLLHGNTARNWNYGGTRNHGFFKHFRVGWAGSDALTLTPLPDLYSCPNSRGFGEKRSSFLTVAPLQ